MSTARWLRILARSPSPEHTDLLLEGLVAYGASSVEQRVEKTDAGATDVAVVYIPEADDAERVGQDVRRFLAGFVGRPVEVTWDWMAEEDWSKEWRRGLGARRVGERFVVTPTWIEPEAEDRIVITIDPQMAFGTGEHATTRGMLRLMERAVRNGDTVLDVGAGSAILAIAAVRLGAVHADAVESDPDAIENAQENIDRNGVAQAVELACALVDTTWLAGRNAYYDVIVANVLSGVLRPLLPSFHEALRPGGRLLLSGILQTEADGMIDAARAAGFALAAEDREEEWWSGLLTR
ncbi:MAG TPA: 50S ribosomal protein L11 methyltransferase [Longimicrobiales bacterium]